MVSDNRSARQQRLQDRPPPPPRPLLERARDYAIVSGASGGLLGACMSTRHHASAMSGALFLGTASGFLGASFIGLRHALIQGDFSQDREAVSGLAAGTIAMAVRTVVAGPKSGATAGAFFFFAGCAGHHVMSTSPLPLHCHLEAQSQQNQNPQSGPKRRRTNENEH